MLSVPNGQLAPHAHTCPLCSFQVPGGESPRAIQLSLRGGVARICLDSTVRKKYSLMINIHEQLKKLIHFPKVRLVSHNIIRFLLSLLKIQETHRSAKTCISDRI